MPQRGFDGAGYVLGNYNGIAVERFASGSFRNTSVNTRDASRAGKWSCFEMEIGNTDAIKFEALQFSLWSPQTDNVTADYWIDYVVMSTQRINCPVK